MRRKLCLCFASACELVTGAGAFAASEIEEIVVNPASTSLNSQGWQIPAATHSINIANRLLFDPDISLTGQGGLLQTFSVRGLSGDRIQVQYDRARIRSLRRAGVDSAFVHPAWHSAKVDPLPASATEGSGSSGGIVRLTPDASLPASLRASYSAPNSRSSLEAYGANETLAGGLAVVDANPRRAPEGTHLNDGFWIVRGQLRHSMERGSYIGRSALVASSARDVGKSSSDYPERIVMYPKNDSIFLSHESTFPATASIFGWIHHQRLDTEVQQQETLTRTEASSFDYGLRYRSEPDGSSLRWGADLVGRSDYEVKENGVTSLDSARELELGVYMGGDSDVRLGMLDWGGRLTHVQSDAHAMPGTTDTSVYGHVRFQRVINAATIRLSAHRIGNQPSSSQLYFTGTTGRGSFVGNPDLNAEQGWTYETGIRLGKGALRFDLAAYQTDFDSLIKKVELTDSAETFINDQGATIRGITAWLEWSSHSLLVSASINHVGGEQDNGEPIRDIPEATFSLGASLLLPAGEARVAIDHRGGSDRVAPGNKAVDSRTLVNASYQHRLSQKLRLELFGENLLNETYFETNDRKSPLGPERTLGIAISLVF